MTAFGLEVEADFPAAGLDELGFEATGSPVSLGMMAAERMRAVWRPLEARTLVSQDSPAMTLDEHPAVGYFLTSADFGSYLLSRDGSMVRCAPPEHDHWHWQRFLTGHVLPLAALLRGFEVFHASAVETDAGVIAFVGASGAGKSSLALALTARGAGLFTDDVLVLRAEDGGLVAHPGAGVVNLRHGEYQRLVAAGADLGREIGRDDKGVRVRATVSEQPRPLAAMYFLNRFIKGPGPRFERVEPVDPARLLGATYNFAIRTPKRLVNQLDVCARLAADVPIYDVICPNSVDATALAEQVMAHAERR